MENIFWIKKLTFFGDYFFFLKEFMFRHIFEKQIRKQLKLRVHLVWIVKKSSHPIRVWSLNDQKQIWKVY